MVDKPIKRFWKFVSINEDGCWYWTGFCHPNGYGRFWDGKRKIPAHRFLFELTRGIIPTGLEPDHLCRNRSCVNPSHLELVTRRENVNRGLLPNITRQRQLNKTYCPQGHSYDETNTYIRSSDRLRAMPSRDCKICRKEATRRWRANQKLVK